MASIRRLARSTWFALRQKYTGLQVKIFSAPSFKYF